MCGSKWDPVKGITGDKNAFASLGGSTATYGCCPANKYMSNPSYTFSIANSCSSCPSEFSTDITTDENDEISCNGKCPAGSYYSISLGCQYCEPGKYNNVASGDTSCKDCISGKYSLAGKSNCDYEVNTCPKGSYSSGTAACLKCVAAKFNNALGQTSETSCQLCEIGTCSGVGSATCSTCSKLPDDCKGKDSLPVDRSCGLRKAVNRWFAGGTLKDWVVATYGLIKNWDMSEVTDISHLFYDMKTHNADISKWAVSGITTMEKSK